MIKMKTVNYIAPELQELELRGTTICDTSPLSYGIGAEGVHDATDYTPSWQNY